MSRRSWTYNPLIRSTPLAPGVRLNQYEVTAPLGAGGMGEVYRARDTRLQRDVAIKILPPVFAADPQRLARFAREAQVLAALNHPHVAQLYGVEDAGSAPVLVMEFVEGRTVAEIIAAPNALPLDEILDVARQIADALEAAHDQGIIHRDLKPANVKVRGDGVVKVLDFGLAKTLASDLAAADPIANTATLTSPAVSQVGVILGTAAYMAPEQARGKMIDRRIDIWAFGCVLFEMLSGKRAFAGETVTDVLSAIISREPDWSELGADVPSAVTVLLHRCLEKDPRKRLRDIGEARLLLETSQAIDGNRRRTDTPTRTPTPRRWVVPALSAAVVALMLTNAYLWWSRTPRPLASTPLITPFDIQPPDAAATLTLTFRPAVAIAANGGAVAFVAASGGIDRVYVRARSEAVAHVIPGSDRGTNPEVSPDGKWVVFVADGAIRKAPIDGEATTIAQAADVRGMSWSDAGTLFLTLDAAAPLVAMSAAGSGVREITTLAAGERTHRWPQALPGGRHVLFTVGALTSPDNYDDASIDAVDVATGERTVVLKGAAMARYCGERQLLYSKGTEVYAIAFDPDRLATTGDAKQVLQAAARDASTGASHFSCSHEGALAFVPGSSTSDLRNLVWVGNSGQSEVLKLQPGSYQAIRISPDGLRVAMLGGSNGRGDIWVYEFEHGSMNRVTFNGTNAAPTWSPDGSTVYYSSFDRSGNESTLLKKPLDGSRDAVTLAKVAARAYITKIEPGEQTAIVEAVFPPLDRGDILRVSFGSTAPPEKIVATPANEYAATVSPSGKWLAYQSDETGRAEVFIRDLAGSGARWQVTAAGGEEPLWSSDGRQLFYRTANRLFAMPVEPGNTFRHGPVKGLFDGVFTTGVESGRSYEFDAASARFLLVKPADPGPPPRAVRVVLNWAVAQR